MELHEKIIFYFLGRQSQIQLRQPTVNLSHENPEVTKLYEDYLGKPLGEKSHALLHTHG